ncbi:MAG: carbonic anhydrase family protein [Rubrivivax sp.]|nr:carbonic anhydrase family protein [Rubrivivax sp.]
MVPALAAGDHAAPAHAAPAKPAVAKPAPAPAAGSVAKPGAEAAKPPVDAAPVPLDPLETLRQRLAERLSATRNSAQGGPYDVRVTPKANAPADAHATAPSAKPASLRTGGHAAPAKAKGSAAATPDGHGPAHWDYKGPTGPAAWGGLKPEFSLCNVGQRQSPIDIRGGLAVDLEPVKFDYQASRFGVVDNGHTVQVNVAAGNAIEVGGKRFELVQFHFHRPSEERIDGRQFEMSVHLVHKDEQGKLAVVALLFEKGSPNPTLQKVWNNLPLERNEENAARSPLELADLLPTDRRYYTYMGSLTTPPCSEGVQWIVMRQPVTLTPEQIDIFARIYPMNARPVQQASGRRIMQSN